MAESVCVVCGKRVTWQFYVCAKCEDVYPRPFPEWLRFLVNDAMRERVAAGRGEPIEQPYFDEYVDYEESAGLPSQRGWGAVLDELDNMGIGSANSDYWESLSYD